MNKIDKNLSEIFDIEPIVPKVEEIKTEIVEVEQESASDLTVDLNLARTNIKSLLNKGDTAIDNLLKVAEASEHPRAYEVAATFIKTLADLNKDLIDIQKKKKDLTGEKPADSSINIDKAVFVGSTTDLIKNLKNKKEE